MLCMLWYVRGSDIDYLLLTFSFQANSAIEIRNWRSAIGKHALLRLIKILKATEPFKSSKNLRKEYVENELKDLSFVYRDPQTKVQFNLIGGIMYLTHRLLVRGISFFCVDGSICGPSTGRHQDRSVLWLCHGCPIVVRSSSTSQNHCIFLFLTTMFILKPERALKLWRTGNAPNKDTKRSFVRNAWAARTAAHYKVISKLSERVWHEIQEASTSADESGVEDPKDLVQLSSEGEGIM